MWVRDDVGVPQRRTPQDAALPPGHHARALRADDLRAAFEVHAENEFATSGERALEIEDVEADWARPSFDLTRDSIGILDGDRLVAAAEMSHGGRRADVAVHPEACGRGLGTWLLAWSEEQGRRQGAGEVGQYVVDGSPGDGLLRAHGYRPTYTAWVLALPEGQSVPDRPVPQGYTFRTARTAERERTAYEVIEAAFGEWEHRDPESFEDWAATTIHRPGTRPWQLRIVETGDGEVIGACFTILDSWNCAYVHQLAVDRAHRGQGLAQALLADAFDRCRARGATRCELSTDSRTGALGLYLKVGMQVHLTLSYLSRTMTPHGGGATADQEPLRSSA